MLIQQVVRGGVYFACAAAMSFALAGCKKEDLKFIDRVKFDFSDNLELASFGLLFTDKVKSEFFGTFNVKDYGYVYLNPYTPTTPFEVGFNLYWTRIVNDTDYVKLQPTSYLPNGEPTGLNPLVELKMGHSVSDKYDMLAYVDVKNHSWLGTALIIQALNTNLFPEGLTIRQVYQRDEANNPVIMGYAFGPTTNPDGSLKRAGGLALFANVRYLAEHRLTGEFKADAKIQLEGPAASYYEQHPSELLKLQSNVLNELNARP